MEVAIDPDSGFCFGVKHAVEQAEEILEESGKLHCLGDIVHNQAEMDRLRNKGLIRTDHASLKNLKGETVLFRAHGEPPSSYKIIKDNNISLADATCPIVGKLHKRIKKSWQELEKQEGQLVIFGNPDHPETIGLRGQTEGQAIIISSPGNLSKIDPGRPIELFSQTTKSMEEFQQLEDNIRTLMRKHFGKKELPLKVHNTICGRIASRIPRITEFARRYEVIVFVGDRKSSNSKVLFRQCKEANDQSWYVSRPGEINVKWFENAKSAGVCGATSTPSWLMENVAVRIRELTEQK